MTAVPKTRHAFVDTGIRPGAERQIRRQEDTKLPPGNEAQGDLIRQAREHTGFRTESRDPPQIPFADRGASGMSARPAAVSGDWLGSSPEVARVTSALFARCKPAALEGPPAGCRTLAPTCRDCSLIGIPNSEVDPRASFQENVARVREQGVPRFPLATSAERVHESALAEFIQADPARAVAGARIIADDTSPPVFEVDAMKRLLPAYGQGSKPSTPEEREVRLTANHALHPSATLVARLAFLQRLDEIAGTNQTVFVTNGGCAAGKGSLAQIVKEQIGDVRFGAIWDAAGEGDALENKWILEACSARGLNVVFGFAENDPTLTYQNVLDRAALIGRVVDPATFTASYVQGSENFQSFLRSPEFQAANEDGAATAIGLFVGAFNVKSLSNPEEKPYPDSRLLGHGGIITADDLGTVGAHEEILEHCLKTLERKVNSLEGRGETATAEDLLRGTMVNMQKFAGQDTRLLGSLAEALS